MKFTFGGENGTLGVSEREREGGGGTVTASIHEFEVSGIAWLALIWRVRCLIIILLPFLLSILDLSDYLSARK